MTDATRMYELIARMRADAHDPELTCSARIIGYAAELALELLSCAASEPHVTARIGAGLETAVALYGSRCYLTDDGEPFESYLPLWHRISVAITAAHAAGVAEGMATERAQ